MVLFLKDMNGRLTVAKDYGDIQVSLGEMDTIRGCVVDKFTFELIEHESNGYCYRTHTTLTSKFDKSVAYAECIISEYRHGNLVIVSPFWEITSVANELSIYLLIKHKIITIHASLCLYKSVGVIFVGSRNSGKSTYAKLFNEQFSDSFLICDNYIHFNSDFTSVSTPMWDIKAINGEQRPWANFEHLVVVNLDQNRKINCFSDVLPFAIGMGFSQETTCIVFDKLFCLSHHHKKRISILQSDYHNYQSISGQLDEILKG